MSMAAAQVSSSLCHRGTRISGGVAGGHPLANSNPIRLASSFVPASPLRLLPSFAAATGINRTSHLKTIRKPVSIRSEQSSKEGSSLDIWLGRGAMIGFAVAITIEVTTGKGLLENFGLTSPLPTVALAVTALVGVLTAVFIFQSASKN